MNSNKKKMKIPKSVLNKVKLKTTEDPALTAQPTTSEEFYDQGVNNEESGDRWFSSDLSKALRFYYRAYQDYKKSLELNPTNADALYNLPRLKFDVYNKYIKDDSVVLSSLDNCADALNDNSENGFLVEIQYICKCFDSSIDILVNSGQQASIGWDLYYNIALAYFEFIETYIDSMLPDKLNHESEIICAIERCKSAFSMVLDKLCSAENNGDDLTNLNETICEVTIESYRMISCVYEVLYDEQLLQFMDSLLSDFLIKLDSIASTLIGQKLPNNLSVSIKVAKLKERSARVLRYEDFISCWNSEEDLQNEIEKQLTEASSTRSFIDKFESAGLMIDSPLKWKILTSLGNKYKVLADVLRNAISESEHSNKDENDALSKNISLLCSIYIERADIDLERSILDLPESLENQTTLQNNCKNFLKNALIYSKKSGGLKESASGKGMRKKRQREAAMRLCLIEGKSQDQWDAIIGEQYWPLELKEISSIEAYKQLFK